MTIDRSFCDFVFDGLGTDCKRCGCWQRGKEPPPCPPYITRLEPDNKRLPNIKSHDQNRLAYITWSEMEIVSHPTPKPLEH